MKVFIVLQFIIVCHIKITYIFWPCIVIVYILLYELNRVTLFEEEQYKFGHLISNSHLKAVKSLWKLDREEINVMMLIDQSDGLILCTRFDKFFELGYCADNMWTNFTVIIICVVS